MPQLVVTTWRDRDTESQFEREIRGDTLAPNRLKGISHTPRGNHTTPQTDASNSVLLETLAKAAQNEKDKGDTS